MVLGLFDCAARFTGESGCVGAISKAAVGVGFNAAQIGFIGDCIHGLFLSYAGAAYRQPIAKFRAAYLPIFK